MIKRTVSVARNVGIRLKNWRFLKLFLFFVSIEKAYHSDFQRLLSNTKNKRFSQTNDYLPANISCMLRTAFLLILFAYIEGDVMYHVPTWQSHRNACRIVFCRFRNVINQAPYSWRVPIVFMNYYPEL